MDKMKVGNRILFNATKQYIVVKNLGLGNRHLLFDIKEQKLISSMLIGSQFYKLIDVLETDINVEPLKVLYGDKDEL